MPEKMTPEEVGQWLLPEIRALMIDFLGDEKQGDTHVALVQRLSRDLAAANKRIAELVDADKRHRICWNCNYGFGYTCFHPKVMEKLIPPCEVGGGCEYFERVKPSTKKVKP